MLEFWIKRGEYDVNVKDKWNRTPLFNVVKSGSIEAVDILLTNGARTDVVDKFGITLLHCAGKSGKVEVLEFWIKRGEYDVNVKANSKRTPLFDAVKSGSIEAVDILLTNGARTDVVSESYGTPLHYAVEYCKSYGNTPLLLAIEEGRSTEIIKSLITKGQADVTAACEKYCINPELSRSEITELLITKMRKLMFSPRLERQWMSSRLERQQIQMSSSMSMSMSTSRPERLRYFEAQSSQRMACKLVFKLLVT
ncbi:PREDICTED: serine/threonine-protein phosphatase 6 regulatory ankyrin repeat subunit C-like [Amphimedon queenslandica]|uniref:SOCS box domain-containing protein n=1 Tax=Amphimedon queenslandica TaxID=400682 RepID=A0AAN0JFQ2_AMPQE|nr:PREDICTED: serine/threonine-protein phosphatase 6 regulatory ankyrin repeat subunit C-like [Amphimedon queenslandica]|eukprot:XP_019855631.1 PREDICTED: serine/threonine-protein phosphatase 6 regulatory ankyrin repeat subunit C-like [Amphimedon queenslandica]